MFYHAKNGIVTMKNGTMEYVRFGAGKKTLIMLPGLGDSLRSMKGTAFPLAWMYRMFAKEYTVYVFSRKSPLSEGYTTRQMAQDQKDAMTQLGIAKADIIGVSMGGMIAQYLAIEHPQVVNKLILVVTSSRPNPTLVQSIEEWICLAQRGDHTGFMDSNLRLIYSEDYYRKNHWMTPLLGKLTKPHSYDRFYIQAQACLDHDAWETLPLIQCPTLIVGGERDRCLGGEASREIADQIVGSRLYMYSAYGHGLYEEANDFIDRMQEFFAKD